MSCQLRKASTQWESDFVNKHLQKKSTIRNVCEVMMNGPETSIKSSENELFDVRAKQYITCKQTAV